ncbi:MAG TPA: DUF3592 domain-containing protein [Hyphomicrobium sp.]|nr:DUF3592 domain-containing protein [Hyphomicrobium sp.]HRO49550.1 DUF3592 domain-containing protein [Hyphomicrobium sp.]
MTVRFKRLKTTLAWLGYIVGSMLLVGLAVNALYPADWRETEATVQSAEVADGGGRSPEAVVRVRASYEVSGRPHEASVVVFRDRHRSAAAAEADNWRAGRTLTLYVNQANPGSVSLSADGGRQAMTVVAVLATPLVAFIVGLAAVVMRRRRQRSA